MKKFMGKAEMEMTLEKAKSMSLDAFMFPPNRRDMIEHLINDMKAQGREVIEFNTKLAGVIMTVVAVSPRPGVIAPQMKKRKTVMEFIQEQ
jgi:hypothetical protein